MTARSILPALFLLAALASTAAGIGYTDYGIPLRSEFARARADAAADPEGAKLVKAADKAITILDGTKIEASYAAELSEMSKVAKTVEKSFAGDAGLNDSLHDLVTIYEVDVAAARADLAGDAAGDEAAAKTLAKVDKGLAKVADATVASAKLKSLSSVAKSLGTYLKTGLVSREAVFVISNLSVAPAAPDNALQAVRAQLLGSGFDVSLVLRQQLLESFTPPLIWLWGVKDFDQDSSVNFSMLNGVDLDANTGDNFLGFETFAPQQVLNADGHPNRRATGPITTGGQFSVSMSGDILEIVGLPVMPDRAVQLAGTTSADSIDGVLKFPVSAIDLISWLTLRGMPLDQAAAVMALADLDLDGLPGPDAFSCALTIDSVTASITMP